MVPEHERQAPHTERRRTLGERLLCEPIEFRADDAIRPGPTGHEQRPDKDEDRRVRLHEDLHDEQRGSEHVEITARRARIADPGCVRVRDSDAQVAAIDRASPARTRHGGSVNRRYLSATPAGL